MHQVFFYLIPIIAIGIIGYSYFGNSSQGDLLPNNWADDLAEFDHDSPLMYGSGQYSTSNNLSNIASNTANDEADIAYYYSDTNHLSD